MSDNDETAKSTSPNQINIDRMHERMRQVLDISPTMCSAKWLQSTVYLMNGFTHSCHHPAAHKIPLQEIAEQPSALHNTVHKKEQRLKMLNGEKPAECQYCWNIEGLSNQHISDRTYKSADATWSFPFLNEIKKCGANGNINPTYLEVAFDNTCNFKCAYCTPDISSKWMEEVRTHGPYPTSWNTGDLNWLRQAGKFPIARDEYNPYVEAFWQWWPNLYQDLVTFRITGGEPLLSKNTWRLLEYIKQNPRREFNLAINTNMGAPQDLIDRLIGYYNDIAPNIRSFEIYTSAEAAGAAAEYIRFGMNYEQFLKNIRKFLAQTPTSSRINFMITFNALSITTFHQFLADVWQLRVDHNETDAVNRLPMMISYLRWPPFMSMRLVPETIRQHYSQICKKYVADHLRNTSPNRAGRFYLEEVDQLERLCEFMSMPAENPQRDLEDFAKFFTEYDRRRSTEFRQVFPELTDMLKPS